MMPLVRPAPSCPVVLHLIAGSPPGTTVEVPDRALGCGAYCPTACNDLESV